MQLPNEGPLRGLLSQVPAVEVQVQPTRDWMSPARGWRQAARTVRSLSDAWRWASLLRRSRPDLVVVNTSVIPAPAIAARLLRIPHAIYVREAFVGGNRALNSLIPKRYIAKFLAGATCTVAVSHYVASFTPGVDAVCCPDPEPLSPPRPSANSPQRKALCGVMVGSIYREKGQNEAVKAIATARRRGAPVELDIWGSGPDHELEELYSTIRTEGAESFVRLRGLTDDPWRVFAGADFSLVCSMDEAYGRVTAESILAGTPVIGYDKGGTREILLEGGGILVAPSPLAMGDAIHDLAQDPGLLAELRDSCIERASRRESFGDAAKTISLIVELTLGSRAASVVSA